MIRDFLERAAPFLAEGVLTPADVHAVALVAPRFGEGDAARLLGLAFAVRAPRMGHAGVDLGAVAARVDDERKQRAPAPRSAALAEGVDEADDTDEAEAGDAADVEALAALPWPAAATWQALAAASPLVGAPTDPELRPFVLQHVAEGRTLLLTRRMFREQELVADAIERRLAASLPDHARVADLDAALVRLFPGEPGGEAARAVRLAATRSLALVVGGPGTGKTFSITRLLAALLAERPGGRPLTVKLAAPTGKAAVRMREAIREATAEGAKPPLHVDAAVRASLQQLEASTLHRLLGVRPDGSTRHDRAHPVGADVVVVDEVSMVDLALMRRLLDAIADDARLVLLGDRDQLASVEAGSVLADLVRAAARGPLSSALAAFTRSHRFEAAPGIALVAACLQSYRTAMVGVPEGEAARQDLAARVLLGQASADHDPCPRERVLWLGAPEVDAASGRARPAAAQLDALAAAYTKGFDAPAAEGRLAPVAGYASLLARAFAERGPRSEAVCSLAFRREVLDALGRYRVLAVHRRGSLGVAGLERALAERVRTFLHGGRDAGRHWLGRPILVTQNAYDVGLMNGDVGLVLPTPGGRAAFFPHERPGEVRMVPLARLPEHEGALAMTVHKSQGSQFERVALVLSGRPSPLQTRELVYTGVTRAKRQLVWLGTEAELRAALAERVVRASGLDALVAERLGDGDPPPAHD